MYPMQRTAFKTVLAHPLHDVHIRSINTYAIVIPSVILTIELYSERVLLNIIYKTQLTQYMSIRGGF